MSELAVSRTAKAFRSRKKLLSLPNMHRLVVASGKDGTVKALDGSPPLGAFQNER